MDDRRRSISPNAHRARLGSESAPAIFDLRRVADLADAQLTGSGGGTPEAAVNGKSIWRRARTFRALFIVACVACVELGTGGHEAAANVDVEKSEIGALPSDFDLSQGEWNLVGDATAAAGVVIEQSGARLAPGRFALAIYQPASLKNAEISVRINATEGKSDQGGGVAVRLSSPHDYYLVQLDARRDRVVFSRVSSGASEEIIGVDADIASQCWHTLTVRAVDNEFTVSLDGNWVFTAFDKTLSQAGRIALWSGQDSVTRFDRIEISPLP
jgi:hypothetical protein